MKLALTSLLAALCLYLSLGPATMPAPIAFESCSPPGMCVDPDGYCQCKENGGTGPGCSHLYCIF